MEKINHPTSDPAGWRTDFTWLLALTAAWLTGLLLANPSGNFPLNDDWSFALTVKHLLETGEFHPIGWAAMPLITNVYWGSWFCVPCGFSFTALRVSTLVAAWLCMFGVYLLMRKMRQPPWLSLICTATVAANPVVFALSNTFMTDVLFLMLMVFTVFSLFKHLENGSEIYLLMGTGLALLATLSRQVGLAAPFAFGVALVLYRGFGWRILIRAILPGVVCVMALLWFQHWMTATGRLPALYTSYTDHLFEIAGNLPRLATVLASCLYRSLMYSGLFLWPVLKCLPASSDNDRSGKSRTLFFTVLAVVIGLTVAHGLCGKNHLMPMLGNILDKTGIGPTPLRDNYLLHLEHPMVLPEWFWLLVTMLSIHGATMLLTRLILIAVDLFSRRRSLRLEAREVAGVFFLLTAGIYMIPFSVAGYLDRYLVPLIPLLAAGIASFSKRPELKLPGHRTALAMIAGFFLFSVCATRDYFSWNRIRWKALNDLTQSNGIKPEDIDGGFEFNGYYLYRPDYQVRPEKSAWWVENDLYQLTFQPVPGCAVFREYHYQRWLPPGKASLFVLKKENTR